MRHGEVCVTATRSRPPPENGAKGRPLFGLIRFRPGLCNCLLCGHGNASPGPPATLRPFRAPPDLRRRSREVFDVPGRGTPLGAAWGGHPCPVCGPALQRFLPFLPFLPSLLRPPPNAPPYKQRIARAGGAQPPRACPGAGTPHEQGPLGPDRGKRPPCAVWGRATCVTLVTLPLPSRGEGAFAPASASGSLAIRGGWLCRGSRDASMPCRHSARRAALEGCSCVFAPPRH